MRYLLDIIYLLALIVISPKIIYRAVKHNRYRCGWGERFGKVSRKHPDKKCIWIHAVSVGEVNATRTLVEGFKEQLSDYEIIISTTTDTGYARAKNIYGNDHYVFYFPADISWVVKRAMKRLKPNACLMMELEVWPNFAAIAESMNIPLVVVNGRISDRSFPRYKLIKPAIQKTFSRINLALAQTQEYAERFAALGCKPENVIITNSLKYDTAQVAGTVDGADVLKQQINLDDERFIVFGGTGTEEENILLSAFSKLKAYDEFKDVRCAIVPRKPERFDEVNELITQSPFTHVRYSDLKSGSATLDHKPDVILGDTMGDLKKFYSLATVVFVGRTMVPMGGSDMMEPAALGKFTIFGKHTFNFKQTVEVLLEGNGAIEVKNSKQLLQVLTKGLTDTQYAGTIAANGQQVIKDNQGATQKTIDSIKTLLQ